MIPNGLYRHYKGNLYVVVGIARHSETEEPLVVYHAQANPHEWWARPFTMFSEIVRWPNGLDLPRFIGEPRVQLVEDKSTAAAIAIQYI